MSDRVNDTIRLADCPFCKSPDSWVCECEDATVGCSTFWVECECGARGSISEYKEGAVQYWNNAAANRAVCGSIEKLSDAERSGPIANREADALSDAAFAFADRGIEYRLPWNCDLDDLEHGQFEAMVDACRAYHDALTKEPEPKSPDSAEVDALRWALEEIIQHAEPGSPPWVVIPDHLIAQAKRALTSG